jgi:hypothetical protein
MPWKVVEKNNCKKSNGSINHKIKYLVKNDEGIQRYVLQWLDNPCIIYDKEHDELISKYNWSYHKQNGYVYTHNFNDTKSIYMHQVIMQQSNIDKKITETVDHINQIKTHNICENLRYTSQSEQNINRQTRNDKLPPPKALIEIGITELPRYVRYDNSEKKFIIETCHPGFTKIKNYNQSGTKSAKVSIIYKYYDILKKLDHLNGLTYDDSSQEFIDKQHKLFEEFNEISKLITGEEVEYVYHNKNEYKELEQYLTDAEKQYERRGLPEDSEINVDELPKYCCYTKASDKRGDSFYVSRHHPHLKEINIKDVKTTTSKAVSMEKKYEDLLKLLDIIDNNQGDQLKTALK